MTIERLNWDSEFFDRNIGRWRTDGPLPQLQPDPAGFDLIYVECVPNSNLNSAPPSWFDAGQKVTFYCSTSALPIAPAINKLHHPSPELETLVWMSGTQSRFKMDPRFSKVEFQRLYSHWMNACLEGHWDAIILGHHHQSRLTGFITLEFMVDHARIGLIAVHPAHRGKGIAGQLVAAAKTEAHRKGQMQLRVSTQGANQAAIVTYIKSGFQLHHTIQQYHWWTQEEP